MDRQAAIDQILDHYDHPRHYGALADATMRHTGKTPGCGDVVTLYIRLDNKMHIDAIAFEGQGCTISQAAASITTVLLSGKTLDEALRIDHETLVEQLGREIVTQRATCATLALDVFKEAVTAYHQEHANDETPAV